LKRRLILKRSLRLEMMLWLRLKCLKLCILLHLELRHRLSYMLLWQLLLLLELFSKLISNLKVFIRQTITKFHILYQIHHLFSHFNVLLHLIMEEFWLLLLGQGLILLFLFLLHVHFLRILPRSHGCDLLLTKLFICTFFNLWTEIVLKLMGRWRLISSLSFHLYQRYFRRI